MRIYNTENFITIADDANTILYEFTVGSLSLRYPGNGLVDFIVPGSGIELPSQLRGLDMASLNDASGDPIGGETPTFASARTALLPILNGASA